MLPTMQRVGLPGGSRTSYGHHELHAIKQTHTDDARWTRATG